MAHGTSNMKRNTVNGIYVFHLSTIKHTRPLTIRLARRYRRSSPHLSSRSTFSNWTLLKASFDIRRQKASLANISPTPMRPHDIPLSGVRKSCRRWFLRVFSLSRSIGTPEPVSKGLSGGRYEMGVGRVERVRMGWEVVDATLCCIDMNLYPSGAAGHHSHFSFSHCCVLIDATQSLFLVLPLRPPHRSRVISPRKAPAARGTQPSSKNTSRSADPKSESTPRISRAILSDQRAIGLTIFFFVALAAQVIFKATFGNGDSNTLELFSRVTYLLMRAYRWPQACLDFIKPINGQHQSMPR